MIFDLDGTVIDNEGDWEGAFVKVIEDGKLKVDNRFRQPNGWLHEPGIGLDSNWKRWIIDPSLRAKYVDLTRKDYLLNKPGMKLNSGVVEVVEKVKELEWATALCTGSSWHLVEEELEELQLYLAFDATTTGEEVLAMKPDPEIYLLAAQKLNLEPSECVVIEDAIAGIRAGMEAGCQTVGLVSDYAPANLLKAAGATYVVESLEEILSLGIV